MTTPAKKPRKKLNLAEQKAKLAASKTKVAEQESKIAVAELKEFLTNLKVANVGSLFTVANANKPGTTNIDILRTLAEIAGLKVVISPKPVVTRAKKKAAD